MGTEHRKSAAIHVAATFGVGFLVLIIAMSTSGAVHDAFIIAGPVVVGLGALAAMGRTVIAWRRNDGWQVWQGASFLLLGVTVVWVFGAVPALVS